MKFLFVVAVALASHAQAVRVNVIQSYGGANCSGAVTATYISTLSGECMSYSGSSASVTCADQRIYHNSTTCEGNFTAEPLSCFGIGSPNTADYACKEYKAGVMQLTFLPSCNATKAEEVPAGIYPLDVCYPSPVNGSYGSGPGTSAESTLAVLSGNQVKMTRFLNGNCQGTGNVTLTLAVDGCSTIDLPTLPFKAARIQVYKTSSAYGLASSLMMVLLVAIVGSF
ncbi:hypothetical protein BASA81_000526 [Batrachochytrium salamandrivorans]|nr:hypothetical protein BASA81_000526 [Batrachochytrium salamandrivorans]